MNAQTFVITLFFSLLSCAVCADTQATLAVDKGDEIDVMVLEVDAEGKRISLGIKQLLDDPWPSLAQRFMPGVELEGTVIRLQDQGVVVDLGDDVEGFVPASHSAVQDTDRLAEYYGPGDTVDLKVIESDAANRRIVLEVTKAPVTPTEDFGTPADRIAARFEERGITRDDVAEAIRWAREERDESGS